MKGYEDDGGLIHYSALELQNGRYDYALCEMVARNTGMFAWDFEQSIVGHLRPISCEERDVTCILCLAIAPKKSRVIARDPHGR